jgi:hypothetical protein
MDDIDVYQSAKSLVHRYGADAAMKAILRADAMIARGDRNGAAAWNRILRAIMKIQPTEGLTKH